MLWCFDVGSNLILFVEYPLPTRIERIDFGELFVAIMEELFVECGKVACVKVRFNKLSGWCLFYSRV